MTDKVSPGKEKGTEISLSQTNKHILLSPTSGHYSGKGMLPHKIMDS